MERGKGVIRFLDIKIAKHSGFCAGVRQALNKALAAAQDYNEPVYTWGPLVHNNRVINDLEQKGIKAITSLDKIEPGVLVIRAHGAPPAVFEQALEQGFSVIDATCPSVKRCQLQAKTLIEEGKNVVVVGKRGHPEIIGICGWAENKVIVVENAAEAKALKFTVPVGVLAQTTQNEKKFAEIVDVLRNKAPAIEVYSTICGATSSRQEAAIELANEVDLMIVIGSAHSANTKQLAQICRETGVTVCRIESASQFNREWLQNKSKVGVIAGASTPDVTIEEVIRVMTENQRPEGQNIEDMYASTFKALQEGEIITGKILRIDNDEVLVDIGYKSEGIIPLAELSDKPISSPAEVIQVGQEVKVYVVNVENNEGNPILSKKRADVEEAWKLLEQAFASGEPVEGEVLQVVKGGLIIFVGLRAFLPASQVGLRYEPNLEKYVGQTLAVKVIELDRDKNKVIVSQKSVLEAELADKREKLWQELAENQVRKGRVTKLTDFGAFVDLGGIEGLVHISELSWSRVKHPSEVLQEGDEIEVMVLGVDQQRERVSLGLKQVLPDPWSGVAEKYPVNSVQQGTVTHIVDFGAFVQLQPGVEGLVHISQLANRRVNEPKEVVQVGDQVAVKVLDVNEKDRRISLSMKEIEQQLEPTEKEYNEYLEQNPEVPGGLKVGEVLGELLDETEEEEAEADE
ncbi:MAG: bifunctional 4-hydroxy-3-methylbut-2-enyl diphosphate reductase/30S ribosomal protein S1 [bacterium]